MLTPLRITMTRTLRWLQLAALLTLTVCSSTTTRATSADTDTVFFTVQAEGQLAMVRAITRAPACPGIQWDGKAAVPMTVRAMQGIVAARADGAQTDHKQAVFDVLTCEATWPAGALRARIAGRDVPAPKTEIKRIVIIADTGCRMKASENAFQSCNDAQEWPFAQVAASAAAKKPDLVIHIGDIHYRESPCPEGNQGCANSAWGYGYDAWEADLFKPAKPLLEAAAWVFVRGNHEACFRAGQGWFRFIDRQSWREARSCNTPEFDREADYSEPYAVTIAAQTQLIVFDSAKTSGKPFAATDAAYGKYRAQMLAVEQLTQQKPHSFFISHHPLLAIAPSRKAEQIKSGGNAGLQSVFASLYPQRLFPEGVDVAMHGHLHYFEVISFKTAHPASLVLGNSASANEGTIPTSLPADTQLYPGAMVEDYAARAAYGFATLDRVGSGGASDWLLTEYDTKGQAVIRCTLQGSRSKCARIEE